MRLFWFRVVCLLKRFIEIVCHGLFVFVTFFTAVVELGSRLRIEIPNFRGDRLLQAEVAARLRAEAKALRPPR